MVYTAKRFSAALLAIWFAVFSVVVPVSAHAATYSTASSFTGAVRYVPGVGTALAGNSVLAAGATLLNRANPWIIAITLGYPIAKWAIENNTSTINLMPQNGAIPNYPEGWTDSNTPPPTAAPLNHPTSSPAIAGYASSWCLSAVRLTRLEACEAVTECGYMVGFRASLTASQACHYTGPDYDNDWGAPIGTYACPAGTTLSGTTCIGLSSCPSGYFSQDGSCLLSDNPPVQWPSDGSPTVVPRAGTDGTWEWWPSDRDPDPLTAATTAAQQQAAAAAQQSVQAWLNNALQNKSQTYGADPYGNPTAQSFTPTASGGLTFQQFTQTTPSTTGQTQTTVNTVTINNAGSVTNVSTTTKAGDISTVINNTSSAPQAITFPDDYNRESTQNKILTGEGAASAPDYATSVQSKTDQINKGITDLFDPIPGQFTSDKGNWFSWVWTPPVGSCSPFVGVIHTKQVSWNICPYIDKTRDVIGWLFAIFGAWMIYNEMFRRED